MSFLKTITILIGAIPEILKLIRELQEFIEEYNERRAFKERMKKLQEAVHEARETKDTSKLDEFFGKEKKAIEGKT